jgi:hypothetical protein
MWTPYAIYQLFIKRNLVNELCKPRNPSLYIKTREAVPLAFNPLNSNGNNM